MSLFKLFLIFLKIGAILLGGGYVILPIITDEFSKKRNLVSEDNILNYFALSQSLPGIIAANISMFIGYELRGKFGAVVAMFGVTFVPFWTIVLLASVMKNFVNNDYVQSIFGGVGVAVIALILLTIREIMQKSTKNGYFYSIFFLSIIALTLFNLTPVQTMLTFTILGVLYKKFLEVES